MRKQKKRPHAIHPETKTSIVGILLVGLALIFVLAAAGAAGPAGRLLLALLYGLLGWGYYLLPLIALALAALFFFARHRALVRTSCFGAALALFISLGIIDIMFPGGGGTLGKIAGLVEAPFGYTAALVLATALLIASLLVTFNASIVLSRRAEEKEKAASRADTIMVPESDVDTLSEETTDDDAEADTIKEPEAEAAPLPPASVKPIAEARPKSTRPYQPPPPSLLRSTIEKPTAGDLRANANIIKRTLESFGILVDMGEINIGPKVTRYTLKPAEGVKLSKITALSSDLALALAAHPLRIESPIPGKSLVGIEVPNKSAAVVRLGSLMSYEAFTNAGPLTVPFGRDVTGELILPNIEKMPHLLVAGATGSGKSILLHAILISLLYKNSPETLRLILIDPKRVELSVYDGIPHLLAPVITEGKKTIGVFRWIIAEMERRYELLLHAGARDIGAYNQKAKSGTSLSYLVVVIDELADLMAAYGREIETSVVRLAQMARATGIHLIVSTQRPSVEVITGLIKANITARVALQVASQVDSRTILDTAGAEKLLGGGDMLYVSAEFSKPKRLQGAYVSDEEVKAVVAFIEEHNPAAEWGDVSPLEESAEKQSNEFPGITAFADAAMDDTDELYNEAVRVVREAKKASASLLQRRLKVGYARAARLLDIMEEKGAIGPGEGAKPREVYFEN